MRIRSLVHDIDGTEASLKLFLQAADSGSAQRGKAER